MDRFDDIPEQALAWHRAGRRAALATVVETWGSAPRRTGAMLAVSGEGELAGSVSGGCVEGAVVEESFEALDTGRSKLLTFGVSDDDAFAVGLACGGTIRVAVQPIGGENGLPESLLSDLTEARAARRPAALVTDTETWTPRLADASEYPARFRADRSGMEEDGRTFVAIQNPPLRLICVGAVHIAQALLPMARIAGYDPVLIDPRPAFAAEHRFPGETILDDWPDDALKSLGLDARTALVLLTHDPKIDDAALAQALSADCFYIGALGSPRTHAKRVERLRAAGHSEGEIARIHAPIGLDIGAAGPAEIAVSIIAEMTGVLRRDSAKRREAAPA